MPPLYFWRWPGAGRAGDPDAAARSSATTPDADLTKGLGRDHLDALKAFGDAPGEAFSTRKS
jgi:hypothetical protein